MSFRDADEKKIVLQRKNLLRPRRRCRFSNCTMCFRNVYLKQYWNIYIPEIDQTVCPCLQHRIVQARIFEVGMSSVFTRYFPEIGGLSHHHVNRGIIFLACICPHSHSKPFLSVTVKCTHIFIVIEVTFFAAWNRMSFNWEGLRVSINFTVLGECQWMPYGTLRRNQQVDETGGQTAQTYCYVGPVSHCLQVDLLI